MRINWYIRTLHMARYGIREGDSAALNYYSGVLIGLFFADYIELYELENARNIFNALFNGVRA